MSAPLIKVGAGYIEVTPRVVNFNSNAGSLKEFETAGKNAGQNFVNAFQAELRTGLTKVANTTMRNVDMSSGIAEGAKKSAKNVVYAWEDAAGKIRFINKAISDSTKKAFNAESSINDLRKVSREYQTQASVIQQAKNAQASVDAAATRKRLADEKAAQAEMDRLHSKALQDDRTRTTELTRLHTQALSEDKARTAQINQIAASIRGEYASALNTARQAYTNLAGAQRTVSDTNSQMNKSFIEMGRNLDQVSKTLDHSTKSSVDWWSAGNRMIGLGQQITQNITVPFIGAAAIIGKFGIDSATALDRSQKSLSALIGGPNSAQVAKQELQDLANFAQKTPFDLKGLQTSAVQLQAAGLSATQAEQSIKAFGNAAGVSGLDTDQFNRIMKALSQSYGAVKVNAQDMMQMQNANLPIWHLMSQATGKTELELRNMSKAGTLLAKDVFPTLNHYLLTNAKYMNGAQNASQTLGGQLQNLQEIFKFKLGLAFQDHQKEISKLIDGWGKLLDALIPAVTSALPALITMFKGFVTVLTAVAKVFEAMPGWAKTGIVALVTGVALAGPALIGLGIAIKAVAASASGFQAAWTKVGTSLTGGLAGITGSAFSLGNIGIVLAGVVAAYELWSAKSQEATQRQQALTQAIEQDNNKLGENTRLAVKNALEKQKVAPTDLNALQAAQKFGINVKTLTDAMMGNADATKLVTQQLQAYINAGNGGNANDIKRALAAKSLLTALNDQQGSLGKAAQAARLSAQAMGQDTNATQQTTQAYGGMTNASDKLDAALQKQLLDLRTHADLIIAQRSAALGYTSALYSLGDAIKGNSHDLSQNTRDGISNQQATLSAIQSAYQSADAMTKNGATAQEVSNYLSHARDQMYSLMVQTGANTNAVRDFLTQYFAIPDSRTIEFNVHMVEVRTQVNPDGSTTYPTGPSGTGSGSTGPGKMPKYTPPKLPSFNYKPSPSSVASAAKKAASQAAQEAKQLAAQRKQQEKAFESSGSSLLKSFAKGLSADAPTLQSNLDAMADSIRQAFETKGQKGVTSLLASLDKLGSKLTSLAKQRDAVFAKIKEAQDFGTSVRGTATTFAGLSNLPVSPTTPNGIMVGLQERAISIRKFADIIKQLAAKKLNKNLLRQVIEAGPLDGTALGQSILTADKSTFKAINDAQAAIDEQAKALGGVAADSIFGSVDAMQKRGASLQKQMEAIAKKAIKLVGNAFNLGWGEIKNVTTTGMTTMNSALKSQLGTTTSHVGNAAKSNKTAWSTMVSDMNSSTKSLVNVTYGKGVAPTIAAMAGLAGVKNPMPKLAFSTGGVVPGYAPRVDDVPAMLSKGEGVMVPEFVKAVGPDTIHTWNDAARRGGNIFANGGVVGGDAWVKQHKNDPFKGYDDALSSALKSVVNPTLKTLSSMAGNYSSIESKDVSTKGYDYLHTWAKKMDKLANSGGNASAVLNVARGELGGPGSHSNKFNAFNNEAWCADFLSWIVDHAHANKAYWGSPSPTPSHRWALADAWNHPADRVSFNQAQPGDIINWPGQHTGIVERGYKSGTIGTIEGNHDPRFVVRATRSNGVISRPHWSAMPGTNGQQPVNPWPGSVPAGGTGPLGNIPAGQFKGQEGNNPSQNRNLGLSILKNMGWQNQWNAVDYIFQHESSWNHHAQNPSGAYGIPQSLPGSKMASQGPDWRTNPVTQILWGLNYMKGRYGSPNSAESFWKSHHWYANGAWEIPSLQAAVLHKGEMVVPEQPAEAFRDALARRGVEKASPKGGVTYDITVNAAPDIPTEKTILKTLSYAHTMYGK